MDRGTPGIETRLRWTWCRGEKDSGSHSPQEKKSERTDMRVPRPLLDALEARASHRGIPYTRLIREFIERDISRPER